MVAHVSQFIFQMKFSSLAFNVLLRWSMILMAIFLPWGEYNWVTNRYLPRKSESNIKQLKDKAQNITHEFLIPSKSRMPNHWNLYLICIILLTWRVNASRGIGSRVVTKYTSLNSLLMNFPSFITLHSKCKPNISIQQI